MDKKLTDRLEDLEADRTDGQGGVMIVHERGELFHDDVSGRAYTHDELAVLHETRRDFVVIATPEVASSIPAYPAHAVEGETLNDIALWNARVMGGILTPEETARLDAFEAERQRQMAEYEAYRAAEEPFFDEQVRRVARLDAKHRAKSKRGRR